MKTLILPGFSLKNKEWADGIASKITDSQVIYWKHWETGNNSDFVPEQEIEKIEAIIADQKVNIIAKSIGTYVAVKLLNISSRSIFKLILCGIPLNDLTQSDKDEYNVLGTDISSDNLLCIMNSSDPHGTAENAKEFLRDINPDIEILVNDRDDHEYPNIEDFKKFLD